MRYPHPRSLRSRALSNERAFLTDKRTGGFQTRPKHQTLYLSHHVKLPQFEPTGGVVLPGADCSDNSQLLIPL